MSKIDDIELSENLKENYGNGHGTIAEKLGHLLDKETTDKLLEALEACYNSDPNQYHSNIRKLFK